MFVTGVPVNIHRNFARSWATTLLARVALKLEVSSTDRHVNLDDTPISYELRLVKHDPVPFYTSQEPAVEVAST